MPSPERFRHGTRARYTCGCRCGACKASNLKRYHERQAQAKALARTISTPPAPTSRVWIRPDGTVARRTYKRGCPGVAGRPCPKRAYLRKDSIGGVCRTCRSLLLWDGLVAATRARKHIRKLSAQGVGYKALGAACDVSTSTLFAIRSGRKKNIRASTEGRILGVDRHALADGALVMAGRTWRRLELLQEEGYSKAEIARRLGLTRPALQFRRRLVTARTAARVERLYRKECVA